MTIHSFVAAVALVFSVQIAHAQTSSSQTVYEPGNGVRSPELIRKVDPKPTEQSTAQKIAGEVWLDVVVKADGTVDVRKVIKSPAGANVAGLDEAAIDAAKQWLFKPGMKDGKPVDVKVVLIMEFRPAPATGGEQEDVYKPEPPVRNPVLKTKVDPKYSSEAMHAKIQGEVWIDAIVETDGTIRIATIKKSLDTQYGLDEAALDAARQWTFQPGTLEGKPVRVRTTLVLEFRLH